MLEGMRTIVIECIESRVFKAALHIGPCGFISKFWYIAHHAEVRFFQRNAQTRYQPQESHQPIPDGASKAPDWIKP